MEKTTRYRWRRTQSRWRDVSCSWIGRVNIVEINILPKAVYRVSAILSNYQWHFSQNYDKIFTSLREHKRLQIAKVISRKKNRTGGINLTAFITYYKARVVKTLWYWHKKRNIDQWIKIESLEINWHTYGHLIFDKRGKNILHSGEKTVSSISGSGKTGQLHVKMKLEYFLTPHKNKLKT